MDSFDLLLQITKQKWHLCSPDYQRGFLFAHKQAMAHFSSLEGALRAGGHDRAADLVLSQREKIQHVVTELEA